MIADFVTSRLGMHVIERTDKFTLVGADAKRGKLTLFEAEGPREPARSSGSAGASRAHRPRRTSCRTAS